MQRLVLLAVGAGKRVRLQQAARAALGWPAAEVLEWRDWLAQPARLFDLFSDSFSQPSAFKIESPGEDAQVQAQLLAQGCALLQRKVPAPLAHGQLLAVDAWFAGFSATLRLLDQQLQAVRPIAVCNHPEEILLMGDKLACQQHLQAQGIPTAQLFGPVHDYSHLLSIMQQHKLRRVFLKARYGSSAAGVLALRCHSDGRQQASSSAQLIHSAQGPILFNHKHIQRYHDTAQIAQVIDLLCQQQAYAEQWLDKPRWGDGHYDVRLVCLGGRAAHRVARIGQNTMTNLHLDNQRGELAEMLSAQAMSSLESCAEQAAHAFPRSHVIGFDIVSYRGRHHVLEANAFGDLLPHLLWQAQDTYAAQFAQQAAWPTLEPR